MCYMCESICSLCVDISPLRATKGPLASHAHLKLCSLAKEFLVISKLVSVQLAGFD